MELLSVICFLISESHFELDLNLLLSINNSIILQGDFNAHHLSWGLKAPNSSSIVLENFASDLGLGILDRPTPTRLVSDLPPQLTLF
ncbi:hypothetical protein CEXT_170191 [Caerostris extrusa]|uniref:Endonuclease/exonuclease/phosphatase domain-containing protein n=1 Tax=Caerostris extrusa TaxID=172846 RepID=A0AAV4XB50_CAEEX|nr:hypothetical protein CEXT_170191 [Caerostris extrusa]